MYTCTFRFVGADELVRVVNESHVVLVDEGAYKSLRVILESASSRFSHQQLCQLPGAEASKEWDALKSILQILTEKKCHRDSHVLIVGGGAFCDACAFAASIYMRGLPFRLLPSTLLAQVDATIGGKTAINFSHKKNFVGTFAPAQEVLWHLPLVLQSPALQRKSGFAEVIKAALLGDRGLFSIIQRHRQEVYHWLHTDPDQPVQSSTVESDFYTEHQRNYRISVGTIQTILRRAANVKIRIVKKDYKESSVRAWLNLGHTFAHAIESCESHIQAYNSHTSTQRYEHGIAVALGIYIAMELSLSLKLSETGYVRKVQSLLSDLAYPTRLTGFSATALIDAMRYDKKNKSKHPSSLQDHDSGPFFSFSSDSSLKEHQKKRQTIRLVLQSRICKTVLREVEESVIASCLLSLGADA